MPVQGVSQFNSNSKYFLQVPQAQSKSQTEEQTPPAKPQEDKNIVKSSVAKTLGLLVLVVGAAAIYYFTRGKLGGNGGNEAGVATNLPKPESLPVTANEVVEKILRKDNTLFKSVEKDEKGVVTRVLRYAKDGVTVDCEKKYSNGKLVSAFYNDANGKRVIDFKDSQVVLNHTDKNGDMFLTKTYEIPEDGTKNLLERTRILGKKLINTSFKTKDKVELSVTYPDKFVRKKTYNYDGELLQETFSSPKYLMRKIDYDGKDNEILRTVYTEKGDILSESVWVTKEPPFLSHWKTKEYINPELGEKSEFREFEIFNEAL